MNERLSTAFHEAGHAVTIMCLGGTAGTVSISVNGNDGNGNAAAEFNEPPGRLRQQKIIQGAVAGPFAQLKARAEVRWGSVSFDPKDRLERFLEIVRTGRNDLDSLPSLAFLASQGRNAILRVEDPDDLGDFESLTPMTAGWCDADLWSEFNEAKQRLDEPQVWAAVSHLASIVDRETTISPGRVLEELKGFVLR